MKKGKPSGKRTNMSARDHRRELNKESKDKDKERESGKSQSEDKDHSDVCKRKPKKKVRKLWGTHRAQHVGQVKIQIASFIDRVDLSVYRNFKRTARGKKFGGLRFQETN